MSKLLTEADIFPWVEAELGAKIVASTRQGGRESGGRPGWFLTVEERGGTQRRYYVRGDRGGDFGFIKFYGLQREAKLLRLLHSEGIPVPAIVAVSQEPNAVLMEFIEGVNDFTLIDSVPERDEVARDFARIAARWHAIPAQKFAEIGFDIPTNREELVIKDLKVWEAGHFPLLKEPVPLVTFACQWMRRNIPSMPDRLVLVQGDTGPGQFLFKNGAVQAVVDWELGALGDPMRELAHIRTRDVWYPTNNLHKWFHYYSEFSGVPLDFDKLRYYNVIGMLTTALALGPVVQHLNPRDDHAEWIAQDVWSKRATAEAIGEALRIDLPSIELPQPNQPYTTQLFEVLEENMRNEQLPGISDSYLQHRMRLDLRLLAHMRNVAEIGREIAELELTDMTALLGSRPADVRAGHRAINELVLKSGSDMDEALTRYFYRHALRETALMRGALGRAEHARTAPLQE